MCADRITGVVGGQGQQGYVEINACEQQQPTRWRWLWGIGLRGLSLPQTVPWVRKLMDGRHLWELEPWLLPRGFWE